MAEWLWRTLKRHNIRTPYRRKRRQRRFSVNSVTSSVQSPAFSCLVENEVHEDSRENAIQSLMTKYLRFSCLVENEVHEDSCEKRRLLFAGAC
jgi:hypothetical protein